MAVMFYERPFFVHTFDLDTTDCIRPAAVLDFFQDAASLHAVVLEEGYEDLLRLGLYWVILYEEFEILDNTVSFGNEVITRTWPRSRNRLEFEREYEMVSKEGRLLAKGISSWCVIGTETRRVERADKVILKGEYYGRTNYPEKINRKLKVEIDTPDMEMDYRVQYTDLDHNKHMNNAKYLDIIYNMHVSDRKVKKCRISFVHEARVGELLHIEYKKTEEGDCYLGIAGNEVCFMAVLQTEE